MKIFSAEQIKKWDAYTITHEPVSSIDLMERAARKCFDWITKNLAGSKYRIFCGNGNNGGDGLAIARMLIESNQNVSVYIDGSANGSPDFETNLSRLRSVTGNFEFLEGDNVPEIDPSDVVIDALFGTGLNKPVSGKTASLIRHLNKINPTVVSIDIPSGIYIDKSSGKNVAVKADHTLTFQHYKLAFLIPENYQYFGNVIVLDIGLHPGYISETHSKYELVDPEIIKSIYHRRSLFSHKGDFGHASLIVGSYGFMGAAVLATRACLRSGAGKVTCQVPRVGYEMMQVSVPEAMTIVNGEKFINNIKDPEIYNTIGIGPGIGLYPSHKKLLNKLFTGFNKPLVIDADALNILSQHKSLFKKIPPGTILTPHPKEFERLFGKTNNSFDRIKLAEQIVSDHDIYIVLKGHFSFIATPGASYFNFTGNPGMATGGSGDVLTGIITGLLTSGYTAHQACLLGVYLHGLAGDIASQKFSQEAMIAGDIILCLGEAFTQIVC